MTTTTPSLPLVDGAFWVSNSFLETVMTCSRASEYYKLHARVAAQPSDGLIFGQIVHKALEMHYRQQEFTTDRAEIAGKVTAMMTKAFAEHEHLNDSFRNLNWAITLYQQYAEKYEFENFELLRYKEPRPCKYCCNPQQDAPSGPCLWCNDTKKLSLMVEVPFVDKLFDFGDLSIDDTIPVYIHGYIDLPVLSRGKLWALDFKTSFQLGQSFFDDKRMSSQPRNYCYHLQKLVGMPVFGYLIRGIRTKDAPVWLRENSKGKKGQSVADWWNETFQEESYLLQEGELDEWRENAIALVREFMHNYEQGFFPKKTMWCAGKYGKCQYFDVCSAPAEQRQFLLSSGLYTDKKHQEPT